VIICEIIVRLLVIIQNTVLLIRTRRLSEIRSCDTIDEQVRFVQCMGRELWYVNLLERDKRERNNDRVMEGCLK
jgi:hypothetical protein